MKTQPQQPWQDNIDPRCDLCYTATPYGEWVSDLPARIIWPESVDGGWGDHIIGGYLCVDCIERLRHRHA